MQVKPTELVILCGGLGSRLQPVLENLPKILAPIAGNTFLDYFIRHYRKQGIERFLFSTGHLGHLIQEYVTQHYPELQALFIQEEKPLGTGGAIKKALPYCSGNHVFVTNGDTLHLGDLHQFWKLHSIANAPCTLQSAYVTDSARYGVVSWNNHNQVISFLEKGSVGDGWINAGTYLLNKEAFLKRNLPECFSLEKDYLPEMVKEKSLWLCRQKSYFLDIGIPEDLQIAQTEIPAYVN